MDSIKKWKFDLPPDQEKSATAVELNQNLLTYFQTLSKGSDGNNEIILLNKTLKEDYIKSIFIPVVRNDPYSTNPQWGLIVVYLEHRQIFLNSETEENSLVSIGYYDCRQSEATLSSTDDFYKLIRLWAKAQFATEMIGNNEVLYRTIPVISNNKYVLHFFNTETDLEEFREKTNAERVENSTYLQIPRQMNTSSNEVKSHYFVLFYMKDILDPKRLFTDNVRVYYKEKEPLDETDQIVLERDQPIKSQYDFVESYAQKVNIIMNSFRV